MYHSIERKLKVTPEISVSSKFKRIVLEVRLCSIYYRPRQILCLFPELLVHSQVDVEVADMVEVVEVQQKVPANETIEKDTKRYKADDVDDSYEDKLRHCHNVSSVTSPRYSWFCCL